MGIVLIHSIFAAPLDTFRQPFIIAADVTDTSEVKIIPASDAITLKGHTADVFVCSWNPTSPTLLASG